MISAITKIASEENNGNDIEETESSPRKPSKREYSSRDNKIPQVRSERLHKRMTKDNLNIRKLKRKINLEYFYDLLFTRKNLKLVHIVCHDKQEHLDKTCDEEKVFI